MSKNRDINQVVSFRLIRSANGSFAITKREVMNRLDWDEVGVGKNLEDDLGYKSEEKQDLSGLIENIFFRDIHITVDNEELAKAATIRDLYEMIWNSYASVNKTAKEVMSSKYGKKRTIRSRVSAKISFDTIEEKTREMIAYDKGIDDISKIIAGTTLSSLKYPSNSQQAKKFRLLIEGWFSEYHIKEKIKKKEKEFIGVLEKAKVVGDIAEIIYNTLGGNK